ncbi:hypothetical protein Y88_2460 [Novosphingobium nitrogenifigens DSM 19370]|uniref:Uncharacterized protein n=1 Tax=Novosphingobium nitrogenifigens DSM 19370 TaxID=983920 RepID=F1Z6L4_9SPHN|nr:hypothetical protein Y88_2460 [Novosphingobium nitrogenifigens DSM 19370]
MTVCRHEQTVTAIVGTIDNEAFFIEASRDIVADLGIIFDQQNSG